MESCASPVYFNFIVGRMSPKTSNRQQKYIHAFFNNICPVIITLLLRLTIRAHPKLTKLAAFTALPCKRLIIPTSCPVRRMSCS